MARAPCRLIFGLAASAGTTSLGFRINHIYRQNANANHHCFGGFTVARVRLCIVSINRKTSFWLFSTLPFEMAPPTGESIHNLMQLHISCKAGYYVHRIKTSRAQTLSERIPALVPPSSSAYNHHTSLQFV